MFAEHKSPGELPLSREVSLTPMKLSEAIREGAKKRPECYGVWWKQSNNAACVITTACKETGMPEDAYPLTDGLEAHLHRVGLMPPRDVFCKIVFRMNGDLKLPHAVVADWLAAQGF